MWGRVRQLRQLFDQHATQERCDWSNFSGSLEADDTAPTLNDRQCGGILQCRSHVVKSVPRRRTDSATGMFCSPR